MDIEKYQAVLGRIVSSAFRQSRVIRFFLLMSIMIAVGYVFVAFSVYGKQVVDSRDSRISEDVVIATLVYRQRFGRYPGGRQDLIERLAASHSVISRTYLRAFDGKLNQLTVTRDEQGVSIKVRINEKIFVHEYSPIDEQTRLRNIDKSGDDVDIFN